VCCLLEEEERRFLQKNPLGFGGFLDRTKTAHFVRFGDSNGVQKL
jgi:hypothetical protein